jgi:chorismate mutase
MPACESAQASAATETVSDRVLLDTLVYVAARRLVIGVDVAAAKFLSGQRIDDRTREQEILESIAGKLKPAERRHALGMDFFRDQLEANKVIQRGLHRYWDEHPEKFPGKHRHLATELRPQLDVVNSHMLLVLTHMENMPPVRRSYIDGLFDRKLRSSTALRQLGKLRRDAADIALRSLYRASKAEEPLTAHVRISSPLSVYGSPPAVPADPHGPGYIPRPSTVPAYYLGRPARVWIAAFRRTR